MQYNPSVIQLQHAALLKTQHYNNKSELTFLDGNHFTLFNNAVAHFTLYLWGHSMSKSPETTDQVSIIYQKNTAMPQTDNFSWGLLKVRQLFPACRQKSIKKLQTDF